MTPMFMGREHR